MSTTKKAARSGGGKRGRRALPGGERKDRLIQTRVADDLDATLREEAKKRRLSVSQLIRNVLEDTFDLVDDVVNETAKLAQTVRRDALRIRDSAQGLARKKDPRQQVESWQSVLLSGPTRCIHCKKELTEGQPAFMGISSDPAVRPIWVCMDCHPER
jgi:hypothetical protein